MLLAEANKCGDDTHADLMREAADALSTPAVPAGWKLEVIEDEAESWLHVNKDGAGAIAFSAERGSVRAEILQQLAIDLLAAAPQQPAVQGEAWRPIATAPKDGSLFLCWVSAVAYGADDEGQPYQVDVSQADFCQWHGFDEAPDGGWFVPCCGHISDHQRVTHWMPLPPPPVQAQGGEK
jgi:hypothetical protein